MDELNQNEFVSQHRRQMDRAAGYDETGHSERPGPATASVFRCKVLEYLGIREGTQRYNVALVTGQGGGEVFEIGNATVPDQSANALSAGTYGILIMQPGEPPVIFCGGGGGGLSGDDVPEYMQAILIRASE